MKYITFIGVDGSGKTYVKDKIIDILRKNKKRVYYEYGGIKEFKFLRFLNPFVKNKINKKIKQGQSRDTISYKSKFLKNISPILYYFEYLFRYINIKLKSNKYDYVISDRGFIDIVVSPNTNTDIALLLYLLLPKPKQILIYADIETLHKRRSDHPKQYLEMLDIRYNKYIRHYYTAIKSGKYTVATIMMLIQ